MTTQAALELFQKAFLVTMQVAGPMLLAVLVVGLIVGILQTATQINEPSIGFVARVIAAGVALAVAGPYVLVKLLEYMKSSITSISSIVQ